MSARATLWRYRLPLTAPLRLSWGEVTEREGLLVRLDSERGAGWGEAAPLPGYSPDTLAQAEAALRDALPHWNAALRSDPAAPPPPARDAPPSARMALGDAFRWARLPAAPDRPLPLAALLTASEPEALASQAADLARRGFRTVKLKVGAGAPERDAERAAAVWRGLDDRDAELRLDANRAWSLAHALTFARRADALGVRIALLEEPTADSSEWSALRDAGMPLAFDETLRRFAPGTFPLWDRASAVVLKPTVLGGYDAVAAWAQAARAHGVDAVVSGCFESGVGHRMAALAALGTGRTAGLGTYGRLAADVLTARLPLAGPLVLPSDLASLQVDERLLTRVA